MARFLFASTAFQAHTDYGGLLATARSLRGHGHEVLWATDPRRLPRVAAAGIGVVSIPVVDPYRGGSHEDAHDQLDRTETVRLWRMTLRDHGAFAPGSALASQYASMVRGVLYSWIQEAVLAESCRALIHLIDRWRPAVLVGEPLMLPAVIAAEARAVPLAGCGYPGPLMVLQPLPEMKRALEFSAGILRRIRTRFECPPQRSDDLQVYTSSNQLQLVYFPHDWYGNLRAPCAENVQYVGGFTACQDEDRDTSIRQLEPPLVLVASSTSYKPRVDVLQAVFEAVRRVDGRVLTAGTDETRKRFGRLPDHVEWREWISYDDVLPRVAAIVHHGGLGTAHAAVRAGTPQLVLPGPLDQILHAEAVSCAGVGTYYVGPITAEALVSRLQDLLSTSAYARAACALRGRFARQGGVPRAAELLVALAKS